MKILIAANGYPTPQDPQWGCFERDQAIALKKMGHEVSILAVDTRFRKYRRKHGINVFHADGIPVYWGYWFPIRILPVKGKLRIRVICHQFDWVYKKLVKDLGTPDLIYAHFLRNIRYSMYLKEKYDIPLVGIEHWSVLMQNQATPYARLAGKGAYPYVDKLLVVSKALGSSIKSKFGVDSEVVYDMLGPEFLDYTPAVRKDGEQKFRFIAVGSLLPRKGYDLLIQAFAASGLQDKCSVRIIGEGPERQRLDQLIEECGLRESVSLSGRMEKGEIVCALRESDAFVLSSRSETFGVVCIEALSQGLPCIATICGGPEEFLTEEDGVLIAPEDTNALTEAMRFIYENRAKYNPQAISERCLGRFAPRVIASQLTRIFDDVVNNHKKAK